MGGEAGVRVQEVEMENKGRPGESFQVADLTGLGGRLNTGGKRMDWGCQDDPWVSGLDMA